VSGIGPKVAGRIVGELKDKVAKMDLGSAAFQQPSVGGKASSKKDKAEGGAHVAAGDAVSALVNLGYSRADAFGAVATAGRQLGPDATVEQLITAGLKELAA